MASRRPRGKGRGHDKTGRSKRDGQHVRLYHYLLKSDAWLSLKASERALYLAIAVRFNGHNNGEISMSVREAARELHIHRDTASKAFVALQEKGFIKCNQKGHFGYKVRHASTWILTEERYQDQLPTKDYLKWKPVKIKPGPESDHVSPKVEPRTEKPSKLNGNPGPVLGQRTP